MDTVITKKELINGWGMCNSVEAQLIKPKNLEELKFIIKNAESFSIIARGLGRSYGDAAQLKNSKVILLSEFNKIDLNHEKCTVTVGAGVSLEELLHFIVPKGYFIPVSPGTCKVTIGGAIASDVHGKNHHVDGSFGNHVKELLIVDGNANDKVLSPESFYGKDNNDKFWATIGGMGLTGIIVEATFSLIPIESSYMLVDTLRFNDLESLMEAMVKSEKKFRYSVAWVDSLDKKGRGILSLGNHAKIDDLNKVECSNPLIYNSKSLTNAPRFFPKGLINKLTVSAFNNAWFYKSPKLETNKIQTFSSFFHTLDGVSNWNNIYGSSGFIQYQFVVPDSHLFMIKKVLETLRKEKAYSFLTVLKRFGKSNKGLLSFPKEGWTLAIDIPNLGGNLLNTLNALDKELEECGGRIYLAKDIRQSSKTFKSTYQLFQKWKNLKIEMDPDLKFCSDISNRLEMFETF